MERYIPYKNSNGNKIATCLNKRIIEKMPAQKVELMFKFDGNFGFYSIYLIVSEKSYLFYQKVE